MRPGSAIHRIQLSNANAADVHRFVARRVPKPQDAEDIAQQTLLLAFANARTCRGENPNAWLFMIARNLIVDYYRARGRVQFVDVAGVLETESALRTSPDATRKACECREILNVWVNRITRRLHLEEQVALLLADAYRYHDKHSAAALSMSLPSFKLMLHGARAHLRGVAAEGPHCPHPTHHVGVTCHLDERGLLALRDRLLAGLDLA